MSQFELTTEELLLLWSHLPGLVLPSFIQRAADPLPTDDARVKGELASRALLDPAADLEASDWSAVIAPSLIRALAHQMTGELVFQIEASDEKTVSAHSSTVTDGVSAGLTVRRLGQPPRPSGEMTSSTVTVTLAPVSMLATLLGRLLPEPARSESANTGPSGGRSESAASFTIGLVGSRALVAAMQSPDRRVLDSVAREVGAGPGNELLQELATGILGSFRVKVFTPAAGCVHSANWYRCAGGWLSIALTLPDKNVGEVTARMLTDAGSVTIQRTTPEAIRVSLLSLVAEGMMDTHAYR